MQRFHHGNLTIGLILNTPLFFQGSSWSCNYMNLLDFFLYVSNRFKKVIICAPVLFEKAGQKKIDLPQNVEIIPIKKVIPSSLWSRSRLVLNFIGSLFSIWRRKQLHGCDFIGVEAQSGSGLLFRLLVVPFTKARLFYIIRGNRAKTVACARKFSLLWLFKYLRVLFYQRVLIKDINQNELAFSQGYLLENFPEVSSRVCRLNALLDPSLTMNNEQINQKAKDSTPRLLYVGRLSPEKNLVNLLKVFCDLKNKYPDLFLGIVGDGPDSSKLKNEIKRLHLMDNVEFYGFIPPGQKLVDLYDFYNIFVLPSFTEGLPRAIFEAMARGNIVVSAKVGSIASFIENGVNGFLFFPYHKQDMEEAIAKAIRLLADSKAHHDLMVNARAGLNQVAFDTRSNLMLSYFKRCLAR